MHRLRNGALDSPDNRSLPSEGDILSGIHPSN
jgi:hypothetical protein